MRAAAYARYSTDKQTKNSIAYQLEEIRKYCRDHDITITATFTDDSGIFGPSQKVSHG